MNIRILALEVTTDQYLAPASATGSIDTRPRLHCHTLPQQPDVTARTLQAGGGDLSRNTRGAVRALQQDRTARATIRTGHAIGSERQVVAARQHDAAVALRHQTTGLNFAAMAQRAGENPNRAILGQQFAQIQH